MNNHATQAERNAIMARVFPDMFRPTTAEEAEAARWPIQGMAFSIGQTVRRSVTGQEGTIESCTVYEDGRFKYVVCWNSGQRDWQWETSIVAVEGGR